MVRVAVLLTVLALSALAQGFKVPLASKSRVVPLSMQLQNENKQNPLAKFASGLKKLAAPILLGASLGLVVAGPVPDAALAARSGGRSGGSSFKAPSMPRSSTALRSSSPGYGGSTYRSSPTFITPMPMFSPFGYSYGFSPFGYNPISLNTLLIIGAGYAVYTILSNRISGSDFSEGGGSGAGSLGNGATVLKIQLSLSSDWSQSGNIMETLTRLAEKNSAMSGRTDLSKLLSDASLALLRRQSDWNSAAYEGEQFSMSPQKAEPYFQKLAIQERSKFEEENSQTSSAVIRASKSAMDAQPTEVVVSLVVAVRGSSSAYAKNVRSISDVKKCLQGLAADALTDEGDNIMAVEVLWTPSEPGAVITERQIIEDYPELVRL